SAQNSRLGGSDPHPTKRAPNISTKPDSSTILKKCCHLFAYDPKIGPIGRGGVPTVRIFFPFFWNFGPDFGSRRIVPATILRSPIWQLFPHFGLGGMTPNACPFNRL